VPLNLPPISSVLPALLLTVELLLAVDAVLPLQNTLILLLVAVATMTKGAPATTAPVEVVATSNPPPVLKEINSAAESFNRN
jgi:hypothetical protein